MKQFSFILFCLGLVSGCGANSGSDSDADDNSDTEQAMDTHSDVDTASASDSVSDVASDSQLPLDSDSVDAACVLFINGALNEYRDHDGTSWARAFQNVQDGINAASTAGCAVWVAKGIYKPTFDANGNPLPSDERTRTFALKSGVSLYGGFLGTETELEQRDIQENETVLSGEFDADADIYSDHVVSGADESLLDGFVITGGQSTQNGGGMINEGVSPTVRNCVFHHNLAEFGGGVYNRNAAPLFESCHFHENYANSGGAMANSSATPTIINTTFLKNAATQEGGAVANFDAAPAFFGCVIATNSVDGAGAGKGGGGMYNENSSPDVVNCTLVGNYQTDLMENRSGSAIVNIAGSSPRIVNSILWLDAVDGVGVEIGDADDSAAIVSYSNVQGGFPGTGNIDLDPLFIDADNGDYRLQSASPCIDAGSLDAVTMGADIDLGGARRIFGDAVDMGAYERQSPPDTTNAVVPAMSCPVFVDGALGADAGHDGSTWSLAYAEVQDGINAAALGISLSRFDTCDVWVAAGTYTPTQDSNGVLAPSDASTKTILLKAGVALLGGFAGTEARIDQRDPVANPTILSGGDSCSHVVTGADNAVLDGFTITGGRAGTSGQTAGGGMINIDVSPVVSNCLFKNNTSYGSKDTRYGGGAMYNENASPFVDNCIFESNQARTARDVPGARQGIGGAVLNTDGAAPVFTDCKFINNHADSGGGGMANLNASPTVIGGIFDGNTTDCIGDNGFGGGMFNIDDAAPTVLNSTFISNVASGCGGAIANRDASPLIVGCDLFDNRAGWGGGIHNQNSPAVLTNCSLTRNTTQEEGGTLYNDASSPVVTNCILYGNTTVDGEVYNRNMEISIVAPTITFSNVQGGCSVVSGCTDDETGNIDAVPMFVNTDSSLGEIDLRLTVDSPCIDTGRTSALPVDELDINGDGNTDERLPYDVGTHSRLVGSSVDMGAHEFQQI